jgi:hypothetical protein
MVHHQMVKVGRGHFVNVCVQKLPPKLAWG